MSAVDPHGHSGIVGETSSNEESAAGINGRRTPCVPVNTTVAVSVVLGCSPDTAAGAGAASSAAAAARTVTGAAATAQMTIVSVIVISEVTTTGTGDSVASLRA